MNKYRKLLTKLTSFLLLSCLVTSASAYNLIDRTIIVQGYSAGANDFIIMKDNSDITVTTTVNSYGRSIMMYIVDLTNEDQALHGNLFDDIYSMNVSETRSVNINLPIAGSYAILLSNPDADPVTVTSTVSMKGLHPLLKIGIIIGIVGIIVAFIALDLIRKHKIKLIQNYARR